MNSENKTIDSVKKRISELRECYLANELYRRVKEEEMYPFSKLLNIIEEDDFLDSLYERFKENKLEVFGLRLNYEIYESREKDEFVYIDKKYVEKNSEKSSAIFNPKFKVSSFSSYISNILDEDIHKEKNIILTRIYEVDSIGGYMDCMVSNLCNILKQLYKLKEQANQYDIKYYNLIIEKITLTLKDITYSYFDYFNSPTINSIKSINSNFTAFFENKTSEKSFKISNLDLLKVSNIRKSLYKNKYIDEISNPLFVKIFDDKEVFYRVNWIAEKNLLVYFIESLITNKIINNPKNKWKKVSSCFLWKGNYIKNSKIKHLKPSKNKLKTKIIDNIIRTNT